MASNPPPKKAKKSHKPAAPSSAAGIGAPAKPPKRRPGAPSLYTPEIAAAICEHIAQGQSLRTIAATEGMPAQSTIMLWLDGRHPEFTEQYARAREAQADKLAEEILLIADDGSNDTYTDGEGNCRTDAEAIQRSKLRVDARKWLASKMAPKKYGDKVAIGGADDLGPVQSVTRDMTDAERPMIFVRRPVFSRERWTHILITFANLNSGQPDGRGALYLDGEPAGTAAGWTHTFRWDAAQSALTLGLNYTDLIDDVAIFDRELTPAEARTVFSLSRGITALHPPP